MLLLQLCFFFFCEYFCNNVITTSFSPFKFQGDQVIIGNVRDSRAVLCRRAPDNRLIPVQLTVDLTPDIPSMFWYYLFLVSKSYNPFEFIWLNCLIKPYSLRTY